MEKNDLKIKLNELIKKGLTLLNKPEVKLAAEVKRNDGVVIYTESDKFAVGVTAWVMDGEMTVPAPDGEHTLEDGTIITVADGVITSLVEKAAEEMTEEGAVTRAEFSELQEKFGKTISELYEIVKASTELQSQSLKEHEESQAKALELSKEIERLTKENKELDTKLSKEPKEKAAKKENQDAPRYTAAQLSAMTDEQRIKVYIENPTLQPKTR